MERAEYNRHSRARMAETAKDASRHAAPDAPERIDHRRRCTRLDHRTCCRGSRGSASLPCHTLRKRVEMCHAGSRRRPILNATTSPLYARRYTTTSGLLLRLRNLLCAGGDVLLLVCGFSLFLFLRRVLVRGFRRFVTHDPKGKVHDNGRQPGGGAFPIAAIVTQVGSLGF